MSLICPKPDETTGKGDVRWVENVVQHMREDGFLLSGSETIIAGQDSVTLRIIPGKRYTWAHLSTDSIDTQLLSAAGLKSSTLTALL